MSGYRAPVWIKCRVSKFSNNRLTGYSVNCIRKLTSVEYQEFLAVNRLFFSYFHFNLVSKFSKFTSKYFK